MNIIADQTTLTVLYSQPISAPQFRDVDNKWRWVKHMDNALVCPKSGGCTETFHITYHGGDRSSIAEVNLPRDALRWILQIRNSPRSSTSAGSAWAQSLGCFIFAT